MAAASAKDSIAPVARFAGLLHGGHLIQEALKLVVSVAGRQRCGIGVSRITYGFHG